MTRLRPRPISLRHKITLLILGVSSIALAVAGAALFAYEYIRFEQEIVADLSTQIDVVSENLAPAIAFDDAAAARQILSGLKARPHVLQAAVYLPDGRLFAVYERPDGGALPPPPAHPPAGYRIEGGTISLTKPARLGNDIQGMMMVRASQAERSHRLANYAAIVSACAAGALIVALLLGARLQHLITRPILDLTRVASEVGHGQDYTLRARRRSADEIGTLVDGFNTMLEQIEKSGAALRASEDRLSHALRGASDGLWDWELATNNVYYSPRWMEMLGYAEHELPGTLATWEQLVHPDDRERSFRAVASYQAGLAPRFEVEFRMHHKAGRWVDILSRAILVRDAAGRPVRMVGTHVDITERKRLERQLVELSDREQARISQDIHDGLCQQLISTAYATAVLEERLRERPAGDCEEEAARVAALGTMIDDATAQAYGLVGGLFPARLAEDGLEAALQEFAAQLSRRSAVRVVVESAGHVRVTSHEANHLFRIAQEAAVNALKHAAATLVTIELHERDATLTLRIADDGVGLPDCHPSEGGFGLPFMRYRAGLIGATLDFDSAENRGTVVTCSLKRGP